MKKAGILFLFLSIFLLNAKSQDLSHDYVPVISSGKLPELFVKNAQTQTQEDINRLGEKDYKLRRSKEEFLVKTNYFIDQMIQGGTLLVNDPVGIYVNKVADELLKNDPGLRNKLQIYVTKSTVVNAYSFDKGVILVNMGLIAQLENEAQLAYILGHEITHYVKKHSINAYMENIRIDQADYRTSSLDEKELLKSNYSKENELEADMEGLNYIMNSNYSLKAVMKTFEVFQYSYLPFEEIDFDKNFFQDKDLILPDEYFLKETQQIKGEDDYDDAKSTHPNIRKRRNAISDKISFETEPSRKKFIVSEEDFKKSRDICRFELCRLYLLEQDYMNAIYASYILLKKYPDNIYLHKIVSKSLYALAQYKSNSWNFFTMNEDFSFLRSRHNHSYVIPYYDNIEGSSQQVYHLFNKIKGDELTTLALWYTWKTHKLVPADSVINSISDSLFTLLVDRYKLHINDFSARSLSEIKEEEKQQRQKDSADAEQQEQSKYDKIRRNRDKADLNPDEHFVKYAFVDFVKSDDEFRQRFGAVHDSPLPEKNFEYNEPGNNKGFSLGIDRVVIVNPFYVKSDERKKDVVEYVATEQSRADYAKLLANTAKKIGLQYEIIDPRSFHDTDMTRFNDFSVVNDWVNERLDAGVESNSMVLNTDGIRKIAEKYGTRYFLWSGIVSVHERKPYVGATLLSSIFIAPIPYVVYYMLKPRYRTLYYAVLFDVVSGEVKMFSTSTLRNPDSKDLVNTYVYDTLTRIRHHKK
jgi:hypothetical protein